MTVEVTGYAFKDGELHLFATDVDERNLQLLERNREDDAQKENLSSSLIKNHLIICISGYRQKAVKKPRLRN